MRAFDAADWWVIFGYLGGIVLFGLWCGRGQRTTRDYFLGNRNLPWWSVSLSIVATETSALTFIGVPALAYGTNLAFIQLVIGYVIARVLLAVWIVPHYFKGEIYSPYQLLSQAFGLPAQRTAGLIFLISGTLAAGVRVYVTCIPIRLLLGIGVLPAVLLFVILSLAYTYAGGIKAVVWTDAIQFVLFMGGGLFTLFYIPHLLPGNWGQAWTEATRSGRLHWLNPGFSLSRPFNLWMGLFGATVLAMSSHGADQLIVQRVLACSSVREGRKALIGSAIVILPLFLVFLLTGVGLWLYYQHHAPAIAIPENEAGFGQNDYIFPIFILTVMPHPLKGLLIVAILAAAMSSVSSTLSALASVSTMDFVRPHRRHAGDEAYYLKLSHAFTLFWAVMLVLVAYASRQAVSILNLAFSLSGLTSGAMLGGLLLAIFWKDGDSFSVIAGMLGSLAAMVGISRWHWIGPGGAPAQIAWPWFTLIGTVITLAVAGGVCLVRPIRRRPSTS